MTTKTTAKVSARRKIAAAALALGAGVLGTGFAAGTITFDQIAPHGMGQGNTQLSNEVVNITGQLHIEQLTEGGDWNAAQGKYNDVRSGNYVISGFDGITNAMGATYEVRVLRSNSTFVNVEKTGTVEAGTSVTIPLQQGDGTAQEVFVMLKK